MWAVIKPLWHSIEAWLVNGDHFDGLLYSLYNWVAVYPLYTANQLGVLFEHYSCVFLLHPRCAKCASITWSSPNHLPTKLGGGSCTKGPEPILVNGVMGPYRWPQKKLGFPFFAFSSPIRVMSYEPLLLILLEFGNDEFLDWLVSCCDELKWGHFPLFQWVRTFRVLGLVGCNVGVRLVSLELWDKNSNVSQQSKATCF